MPIACASAGRAESADRRVTRGLVILYTGHGKGKTTAALGLMLRAWGHGLRPCVIQFIKDERVRPGERLAAERLGIPWHVMGLGFTYRSQDLEQDRARALEGWTLAQSVISSGAFEMVILDEFTYPLTLGWLSTCEVVSWLRVHLPEATDLVITGRDAPTELVEYADLVTEMSEIKHPYQAGVAARRGIEF